MAQEFQIEQEYGRAIPPILQDEVEKAEELAELEFDAIEETEDGGAVVLMSDMPEDSTDFYDNLAEVFPSKVLSIAATNLLELIEKDKTAREGRDKQYEEGIRRTGMGDDAPGGASFQGAAKTVHPIMAEACVDFAARAIKELCPPQGPVRTKIVGKVTREKTERADRKRDYMNYQLTTQIANYRKEIEQLLTQLPLGGGQYLKMWYDKVAKAPDCEFVPIDNIYLPFACSNFRTSPRITHAQDITRFEYDKRVRTGLYRDVDVPTSAIIPDQTAAQIATDKVEGKETDAYNEDGLRRVYEIHAMLSFDEDEIAKGDVAPYIITIDENSKEVLALYRNWEEDDIKFTKLEWIVEFPFIPWRGAYPIGLPQLIGGLSAALTGALRALLDTAHINNSPSLIKLKGAGKSLGGQSRSIDPTEVVELEGPVGVDDVRKLIMPVPYNPPSAVLFQLLDWLTNQAKGVVATATEAIAQATNSMPVGTALALIEQGSITYSAIHSRLHNSQAQVLAILNRLNRQYLDEEVEVEELGGLIVKRADFEGSLDVIPVSDPNIFSEAQRYAQVQAVLQLETVSQPGTFNTYEVRRRALSLMHVDDIDSILPPPPVPKQINAVAENVAVTYNQPLAVFPEQDHLAHMQTHLQFITDPNAGGNPLFRQALMPMMEHIKQHITMYYAETVNNALQVQGAGSITSIKDQDDAIAQASMMAQEAMGSVFSNFAELMQQAMQAMGQMQQAQQQAIQDPSAQAMLQAALAETERKKALDAETIKLKQQEAAQDGQLTMREQQIKQEKQNLEHQRDLMAQEQLARDQMERLQKEIAELQLKYKTEASTSEAKQRDLDLKEKALMLDHHMKMLQAETARLELQRKIMEAETKSELEGSKLDLEQVKTFLSQVQHEETRSDMKEESDEKEDVQAIIQKAKEEMLSEMKAELKSLTKTLSTPRKLVVKRDKKGKAVGIETEE